MIRPITRSRFGGLLTLLAASLTAAACGNLTAGGVGEATVVMSGDAPDASPASQQARMERSDATPSHPADTGRSAFLASESPEGTDHDDNPEGELEADLTLALVAADGGETALTEEEVRVRVDLEGIEEPEITTSTVPAATYTALRIVFTEIEVEVDAGLVIGGVEVTGPIDVEFEGELPVTKTIDVEVRDGDRVELLIDLNAERWLQAVDPLTATVDAQVFVELIDVVVR